MIRRLRFAARLASRGNDAKARNDQRYPDEHMKHLAIAFILAMLASCGFIKTNEVSEAAGVRVPTDRVLTSQSPEVEMAKFTITRDTGYLGGGCFLAVEIDRRLAARFDTGESATFYVKSGRVELSVVSDPLGRGLCGAVGFAPVRETYDLQAGKPIRFRLSSRQYRRPELESNDVEPIDGEIKTTPSAAAVQSAPARAAVEAPTIVAPQSSQEPTSSSATSARNDRSYQSKYQYAAESLAKDRQCTARPVATLVATSAGSETFSMRCDSGETLIARCDFGNCRVLQ